MTINERMTAAGIPGRPYTIAAQLDWAAAKIAELEAALASAQEREKEPKKLYKCKKCGKIMEKKWVLGGSHWLVGENDGLFEATVFCGEIEPYELPAPPEQEA